MKLFKTNDMQIIRISQEQLSFKLPCDLLATHQWHFSSKFHFSFSFYIVLVFKNIFLFYTVQMQSFLFLFYYAALLSRRGPHNASHSVRPSVCLSVRPVIDTERHVAPPSELQ